MEDKNKQSVDFNTDTPKEQISEADLYAKHVDNILSKDTYYIFLFGKRTSGKTALIQSLIRYLEQDSNGILTDVAGNPYISRLRKTGNKNEFSERTVSGTLEQLDFRYKPHNPDKRQVFFTILEMAGEDLEKIEVENDSNLPDNIKAFFQTEGIRMIFLLCTPYDEAGRDRALLSEFIQYVNRNCDNFRGLNILLAITKADKNETGNTIEKFVEERVNSVYQQINIPNTNNSATFYTVGKPNDKNIVGKYDIESPRKLWFWLYKVMTGSLPVDAPPPPLPQPPPPPKSFFKKMLDFLMGE